MERATSTKKSTARSRADDQRGGQELDRRGEVVDLRPDYAVRLRAATVVLDAQARGDHGTDRIIDEEIAEIAKHSRSAPAPRIAAADTRVSDLVYTARAVTYSRWGEFPQGTILEKTHPIVAEAPDAFMPLAERLA